MKDTLRSVDTYLKVESFRGNPRGFWLGQLCIFLGSAGVGFTITTIVLLTR